MRTYLRNLEEIILVLLAVAMMWFCFAVFVGVWLFCAVIYGWLGVLLGFLPAWVFAILVAKLISPIGQAIEDRQVKLMHDELKEEQQPTT